MARTAAGEGIEAQEPELIRVFLLIDVSSSMTGQPLTEAQTAAREFLSKCDFTTMEVGLISFSTLVALQAMATSNVRRLHAGIHRLEAEGSTNLTDALEMARGQLVAGDRKRYVIILTDGYPDAPESAVEQATAAHREGIEIVAIGTGDADRDYLRPWRAANRPRSSRGAVSWSRPSDILPESSPKEAADCGCCHEFRRTSSPVATHSASRLRSGRRTCVKPTIWL